MCRNNCNTCTEILILTYLKMKLPTNNAGKQMTDDKLWLLYSNTWNPLTMCKGYWAQVDFKNVINKMCLRIIYIFLYMYKQGFDGVARVIVAGIGHGDTSSNPGLIAFHIALIPLGKVSIQLFSLQLWVNCRADYVLQPWWGN